MPLYKRKPFPLVKKPKDLKPHEQVFQVRFTKEIFRDYRDYLNRINLYRRRIWTCKVTGKSNLTYEEAFVSEQKANDKIKQFPKELVAPVLREIQFSLLPLRDLANAIAEKMQGEIKEGSELSGRRKSHVYPCKIIKFLKDDDKIKYEVAWLDKEKKVIGYSILDREDLIKKPPFTREVLKSFIKESTYRNVPWVLHEKLAVKHGISTDPPEELKGKIFIRNGLIVCNRKRKKCRDELDAEVDKSEALEHGENKRSIKYPIEDLLVDPAVDGRHLTERPAPCRDFNVPMDSVGDLLMVWDFCTSFGRLLNLSPYSLEDFEGALCHKESNVVLVVESHSALLRFLLKDNGAFSASIQNKKRKPKITLITWADYLCDFLEFIDVSGFSGHISTIKRGHYGLLEIAVKLRILRELIALTLETDIFRGKLDEYIEERQALAATKRGEAIEEGRKRREEKERRRIESNEMIGMGGTETIGNSSVVQLNGNHGRQDGKISKILSEKVSLFNHDLLENSEAGEDIILKNLKKKIKKPRGDMKITIEGQKDSSKRGENLMKDDIKDNTETSKITREDTNDSLKRKGQKLVKDDSEDNIKLSKDIPEETNDSPKRKGKKMVKEDTEDKIEMPKSTLDNTSDSSKGKGLKLLKDDTKHKNEMSKEQRREYLEREIEKRFIRTNVLGKDRNYHRYWFFQRDGRIFIENPDSTEWAYYSSKEELDALMGSLNPKGQRERDLKKQLEKIYNKISSELRKRSKELAQRIASEEAVVRRSTRVRAPPRDSPALAFLKYENRWKED